MRSPRANHNVVAVSANTAETAINTEQTLDTAMLVDIGDVPNLEPRREDNADELTGKEEADTIYDNGATSKMPFNFNKAQAQHFAFLAAYGLGSVSTAASGTGYKHTITPIDGDLDDDMSNPCFTLGARLGKTVAYRRFASMAINSLTATMAKDDWVKIKAEALGTGKHTDSITDESISAAPNATSLTLAANAVAGASAAERLAAVHRIRVELDSGVWTEVDYSAVSSATPAVITISAPDEAGDNVTYKVLYAPDESAWMSLPSRVSESPLRVSGLAFVLGGAWGGSSFSGGRTLAAEINAIEWVLENNLAVEFVPGAAGAYAARSFRNNRSQSLKLDREFRDFILQQHIEDNDTLGAHITLTGAEYASGENWIVELIFPSLGVLSAPLRTNGKLIAEAGDLKVLEDDTYGSVIVNVTNQVATYAA